MCYVTISKLTNIFYAVKINLSKNDYFRLSWIVWKYSEAEDKMFFYKFTSLSVHLKLNENVIIFSEMNNSEKHK